LRESSRLKSLRPSLSNSREVGNQELLEIAGALRENKSLVELILCYGFSVNDETWGAIYDSLETHPTLKVLNQSAVSVDPLPLAVIKSRIKALSDMLKVNMSIHKILLEPRSSYHELYQESVIPYLKTNRFRPRLLAIQKTRPIPYRAKVLGRALLAVRTDPNSFWMLLSGNAEVAFPSTTTTIVAPAAANTSTANDAVIAVSVISALTTTVTGSLSVVATDATAAASAATPFAASALDAFAPSVAVATNVATPYAGQKYKAGPNPTR
jgi:hypothetical protein